MYLNVNVCMSPLFESALFLRGFVMKKISFRVCALCLESDQPTYLLSLMSVIELYTLDPQLPSTDSEDSDQLAQMRRQILEHGSLYFSVHGNWSEWINATDCSVTCGIGVRAVYRLCNNPSPGPYAKDCEGNSTDFVECQRKPCQGMFSKTEQNAYFKYNAMNYLGSCFLCLSI